MNVRAHNIMLTLALSSALAFGPATGLADDDDDDYELELQEGERCFTFKQSQYDGGGKIKGMFCGIDRDGDGVLYSMSGFMAVVLGQGRGVPGNEFTRVEITFKNFFGIPQFTQVFDESQTPINQIPAFDTTAFMGFVFNLDGDRIGDEPNEGLSLSPLAPSVAYVMGPVFGHLLLPPSPVLEACGLGEPSVCGAVQQLGFDASGVVTVNEAYSGKRVKVKEITDD